MALAFLAGLWTATLRARREKISGEHIADVTLWLMVGAILGARIVYVTTYWKQEFADQPFSEVFMIQHGGLVYYGGLIGATVAGSMISYSRRHGCRQIRNRPGVGLETRRRNHFRGFDAGLSRPRYRYGQADTATTKERPAPFD